MHYDCMLLLVVVWSETDCLPLALQLVEWTSQHAYHSCVKYCIPVCKATESVCYNHPPHTHEAAMKLPSESA